MALRRRSRLLGEWQQHDVGAAGSEQLSAWRLVSFSEDLTQRKPKVTVDCWRDAEEVRTWRPPTVMTLRRRSRLLE